jgi:hypothetical protein
MRMPELHDLLERRASRYDPPPDLFDRVLDRRRRRDRNRRIGTAVVALAVAAAAIGGLARAFLSGPGTRPADEPKIPEASRRMWPQSSLEEVREAQELADAGDPRYPWQLDPKLAKGNARPYEAEIFARFLREELGWQEFRGAPVGTDAYLRASYDGVVFVRCAPGRTNPLYPNDPQGRGCAPTIDELRYETVAIDVKQLDREGRTGIWVVTGWEMLPQSDVPVDFLDAFDVYGMQQVVPPTDAEVAALLEAFLQARIDGEGAEEYLKVGPGDTSLPEIPRLYATSSGASYERFDFALRDDPAWPTGGQMVKVRLFADGGSTVVKQSFLVDREGDGRLTLLADA